MRQHSLSIALFLLTSPLLAQHGTGRSPLVSHQAAVPIPFIGCPSDGQLGPQPPPKQASKTVHLAPELALKLAWYQGGEGQGVLAPRGWTCFNSYGSNGSTVYVSAQQLTGKIFFSGEWKGFEGPAIQLSVMSGGTSGRFAVAETIGLVFPAYRAFANAVANEHLLLDKLPDGPFRTDELKYRDDHTVEFVTPPQTKGIGTKSWLIPNGSPIRGVEILTAADTDLVSLDVRLPSTSADLSQTIIQAVEDANREPPAKP